MNSFSLKLMFDVISLAKQSLKQEFLSRSLRVMRKYVLIRIAFGYNLKLLLHRILIISATLVNSELYFWT